MSTETYSAKPHPRRFALGLLMVTRGAKSALSPSDLDACFRRHASGDYGNLCAEDLAANLVAIAAGERILSAYECNAKQVFVITEADRSCTTLLLGEEY